MEYIGFNNELTISDLVKMARMILGSDDKVQIKGIKNSYDIVIGVSDGRSAVSNTFCFIDKLMARNHIEQLKGSFIITNAVLASKLTSHFLIVVEDPRTLFIDMLAKLQIEPGFSNFASVVDAIPEIHPKAKVHQNAIVEEGVFIGSGSKVAAGCVVKQGTYIGTNVTIRENTVIGCDGIALYKTYDDRVLRFPHLASVVIEDEVEIGASCVIPRGVMASTYIGSATVIGNLSNLGHSVRIGSKVWMSVGCLIGGNTTIGDRSTLGLGVSVRDNLHIGSDSSIGMGAVVVRNVQDGSSMFGNPAKKMRLINAGPDR